ncbi:MAG: adenylate kinase [Candidatus Omnitrophica bacterium]|nr:adenylate kinase [Candidatus Omnitrophota bacterium]MCB9720000.1 adenylate kinase [Candidatus Omnitrophota bacterium]
MNIALLGPTGAGKGTHAQRLIKRFDLLHLDTGELFHEHSENHTAIGFLAQRYVQQGEFVPDEVVDALVAERLWHMDKDRGVLFDGFPRTASQAEFLDKALAESHRTLDAVIYLDVKEEHLGQRILKRITCPHCHLPYHPEFKPPRHEGICDACGGQLTKRPDDIPQMLRVRQRAFRRAVQPVLDHYRTSRRLLVIAADDPVELVLARLIEAVETVQRNDGRPFTAENVTVAGTSERDGARPDDTVTGINLILVGAPGSGKGTQAEQLRDRFGLTHIATGDLFRENLNNKTELGQLAKTYMDRGALVPDEVTEAMVEERLAREPSDIGFILDGFPRTLPQARALEEILVHIGRRLHAVLYIKVSDNAILKRLGGRRVCRSCQTPYHAEFKPPRHDGICDACGGELYQRDDDNPVTIHSRLSTFHQQTAPIINFYQDAGLLIEIDGEQAVDTVVRATDAAVHSLSSPH